MATWGGYELPAPTNALAQIRARMPQLPDEWQYPGPYDTAEPDYNPKPGQKGYDPRQQMARTQQGSLRHMTGQVAPANALFGQDPGYWLASTPQAAPPNVWLNYLNWLSRGQRDE